VLTDDPILPPGTLGDQISPFPTRNDAGRTEEPGVDLNSASVAASSSSSRLLGSVHSARQQPVTGPGDAIAGVNGDSWEKKAMALLGGLSSVRVHWAPPPLARGSFPRGTASCCHRDNAGNAPGGVEPRGRSRSRFDGPDAWSLRDIHRDYAGAATECGGSAWREGRSVEHELLLNAGGGKDHLPDHADVRRGAGGGGNPAERPASALRGTATQPAGTIPFFGPGASFTRIECNER